MKKVVSILAILTFAVAGYANVMTFTVTNENSNGIGSLRSAIKCINKLSNHNTENRETSKYYKINFADHVANINLETTLPAIKLYDNRIGVKGTLPQKNQIIDSLSVEAKRPLTIKRADDAVNFRILETYSGRIHLTNITLCNGIVSEECTGNTAQGGGILNSAILNMNNCVIRDNKGVIGAGIGNISRTSEGPHGTIDFRDTKIINNAATYVGGGISTEITDYRAEIPYALSFSNCEIIANSAEYGSAIFTVASNINFVDADYGSTTIKNNVGTVKGNSGAIYINVDGAVNPMFYITGLQNIYFADNAHYAISMPEECNYTDEYVMEYFSKHSRNM